MSITVPKFNCNGDKDRPLILHKLQSTVAFRTPHYYGYFSYYEETAWQAVKGEGMGELLQQGEGVGGLERAEEGVGKLLRTGDGVGELLRTGKGVGESLRTGEGVGDYNEQGKEWVMLIIKNRGGSDGINTNRKN